ncbi:tellurite resistance protein TehB [Rubripirellula amarantea]|uniref:Tellurite resistance protein TehB n=1 Tax=Rubripirellula amarantea TaxID=2527999 RepID=A0A5C5WGS5_9BACT|nr:methyltransferase domain-containing protein [Rubripirellula amarantea]TWT49305.1 tellurite resistance protein TehB [Rubripirellula amarantea]
MNEHSDNFPATNLGVARSANLSSKGWQERYELGKTGWDRGGPNPMLSQWLKAGELRPCKILVPGCGRGHEVIALAEAGFDVTAVDFADAAVQSLKEQLTLRGLNAVVVQSDIFTFSHSHAFDAIYEQTCLCAIHPSQWNAYEQRLARLLLPEGSLFGLFMQSGKSDEPPFSCDLPTMQTVFALPTWQWSNRSERVDHPSGMHEIACVLTRKGTDE